jgi:hypothetical protein
MSTVFVRCAVNEMDSTFLKYFQKLLGVDGVREGELQAAANDRLADALQNKARSVARLDVQLEHQCGPARCRTRPSTRCRRGPGPTRCRRGPGPQGPGPAVEAGPMGPA